MQSCLEFAKGKADIVLLQEPWISLENTTITHPAFTSIIPLIKNRPRVLTFISKENKGIKCTPRPDVLQDSDLQVLSLLASGLEEILLLNIYNEKSLEDNQNIYTVERVLSQVSIERRMILCGDLNAHHPWWNSSITEPRNSKK